MPGYPYTAHLYFQLLFRIFPLLITRSLWTLLLTSSSISTKAMVLDRITKHWSSILLRFVAESDSFGSEYDHTDLCYHTLTPLNHA